MNAPGWASGQATGPRVYVRGEGRQQWVDPAYWLAQGWLTYVGPAGPELRARLGLAAGK